MVGEEKELKNENLALSMDLEELNKLKLQVTESLLEVRTTEEGD